MKMAKMYYVIPTALILCLCALQNSYGQINNTETNTTRSFTNCYDGTMKTFLLQIMVSPPEIKFNITDLHSPEVKQYISYACNFYHEKSGVWLSGTDDALDREIVSKYGAEFMQKVKEPESIKQRDEAIIQLNKTK
jgi:hypothetical protein